ncbi:MAG: hypothetical protein HGA19_00380 [Oscillochloris sp.]|nr:hypothetical protein [Oscillochloris sp.]
MNDLLADGCVAIGNWLYLPPKDIDDLAHLRSLAVRHGAQMFYADFLAIYHQAGFAARAGDDLL